MVPKLNLKDSVLSPFAFEIGCASEKFRGPIGLNQSRASPIELRILLSSSEES